MKYEWRKQARELYGVKGQPQLITVPQQKFIMIQGTGNPNHADFSEKVGLLYSLAYPIKMRFKKMASTSMPATDYPYEDYTVFPLEGLWTSANPNNPLDKDSFIYTIMIRQPDFITSAMFEETRAVVQQKKPHPLLNKVLFDVINEGPSIQMLHLGSFDDEPATFAKMDSFAEENGLKRLNHYHREIYLNDARKTAPEKRKTLLRFQVE